MFPVIIPQNRGAPQKSKLSKERKVENSTDEKKKFKELPWWTPFVSGFCAGVCDTIINYPPYGLHYRMQRGESVYPRVNPKVFTPRELYRGITVYSFIIPITLLMDGTGEFMKKHGFHPALAAFLGGTISATIISAPVGNVIVTQQEKSLGPFRAINFIIKNYGLSRFTTGTLPLIYREGIYSCSVFYFPSVIERNLNRISHNKNETATSIKSSLGASVISGMVAAVLSQPFDVITTRMQKNEVRKGPLATAQNIYYKEGIKRFFSGLIFRGYAVVAGVVVMHHVVESVKSYFRKYLLDDERLFKE